MAYGAETKAKSGDRSGWGVRTGGRRSTSSYRLPVLCVLTSLALLACEKRDESPGASPPPKSDVPAKQARPRAERIPQEEKQVTEWAAPDLFKRGRHLTFERGSSLVSAVPERFSRSALGTQKLHLASLSETRALWLAIDHHAPRRALSPYFTLSEFVNEDVELAPGSHFLTAFELNAAEVSPGDPNASDVDSTKLAASHPSNDHVSRFQIAGFSVDVGAASLADSPGCLLFTPQLTKNGKEATKEIRFLAIPLAPALDKVEYSAVSDGLKARGEALPGIEMILENPPAGDVELVARCFSAGEEIGRDEQTVTVNPEALEKERTP